MSIGLTLGKFAPFHHGHQHLIDTARKKVDHLIILIYPTDVLDIPLSKRAGWIRDLYQGKPKVTVIECPKGPQATGHDPKIMKLQEKFVLKTLSENGNPKITHFFSSEWYGQHMSQALGAKNVIVDIDRKTYPISGTIIRGNTFKYRKYMHSIVYKDLIKKIVFLGAESTGKSTLAKKLATKYYTQYVPEYGRDYWEKYNVNGRLTLDQLTNIAKGHLTIEERYLYTSNRYLFIDTNAITTYMFSLHYHGKASSQLTELAKKAETEYDHIFVCGDDIPYHEDGTREGDQQRHKFQKMIIKDLKERGLRHTILKGSLDARIKKVDKILRKM